MLLCVCVCVCVCVAVCVCVCGDQCGCFQLQGRSADSTNLCSRETSSKVPLPVEPGQ